MFGGGLGGFALLTLVEFFAQTDELLVLNCANYSMLIDHILKTDGDV